MADKYGWEDSDIVDCACGRGRYDAVEYKSCYECYLERRSTYESCIFCGRWHSPKFSTCYKCRIEHPEREEAARNLRLDILIRDQFKCRGCGKQNALQIDHIKPCCEDGSAAPWNLQALCQQCNHDKGTDWQSYGRWDQTRILLMHTYFTFGWKLLDGSERNRLATDAADYPTSEFGWHAHYREIIEIDQSPVSQWAIDMANEHS